MSQVQQQDGQHGQEESGGVYVDSNNRTTLGKINEKYEDPDMEYVDQLLVDENSNLSPAPSRPRTRQHQHQHQHQHQGKSKARKNKNDGNETTGSGTGVAGINSNSREVVARRKVLEAKDSITSLISSPSPAHGAEEAEAYGVMVPVSEYHEDDDDQGVSDMLFGEIQTRSAQNTIMARIYAFTWAEHFYTSVIPRFAAGVLSYSFYSAVARIGSFFFSHGHDFANKYLHPGQLYPKEDIVRVGDYKVRVCGNKISLRAIFFNNEEPDTALRLIVQVPGLPSNALPENFISTVLVEDRSWSCIFKEEKGLVQVLFREGISPKGTRFYPPGGNGLFTIDVPANSTKSIN